MRERKPEGFIRKIDDTVRVEPFSLPPLSSEGSLMRTMPLVGALNDNLCEKVVRGIAGSELAAFCLALWADSDPEVDVKLAQCFAYPPAVDTNPQGLKLFDMNFGRVFCIRSQDCKGKKLVLHSLH